MSTATGGRAIRVRVGWRLSLAVGACLVALLGGVAQPASASSQEPPPSTSAALSVELDRKSVANQLGGRFSFASTVRNNSDRPVSGLVAHLNVLSPDPDVYVDPEDWSGERTQFLAQVPAGGTVTLNWKVQSVNSGQLLLYVAVMAPGGDTVTSSAPLPLKVENRRTIDAGGLLPVVAGIPGAVLVLLLITVSRRRRSR